MTMQLQVICDGCGQEFVPLDVPYVLEIADLGHRNDRRKDLCDPCFSIINNLLYRSATPEDNFGAVSDEAIRAAISKMAERRKEVFERENK